MASVSTQDSRQSDDSQIAPRRNTGPRPPTVLICHVARYHCARHADGHRHSDKNCLMLHGLRGDGLFPMNCEGVDDLACRPVDSLSGLGNHFGGSLSTPRPTCDIPEAVLAGIETNLTTNDVSHAFCFELNLPSRNVLRAR